MFQPFLFLAAAAIINHLFVPPLVDTNTIDIDAKHITKHKVNAKDISTRFLATNTNMPQLDFLQQVDDETTVESFRDELSSSPLALVIAVASFAPKCKSLLTELQSLEADYASGSCCGPSPTKPRVLIVSTDESDDLEELAIELGLNDVPSYQIYKNGQLFASNVEGEVVSLDSIRGALQKASTSGGSSCCAPGSNPAVCCPDGSGSAPTNADDVRRMVQESYAATVNNEAGCCVSVSPELVGYTQEQILKAGKDSNLGLGCGNPMSFANIQKGETILDLGSGAGVDCFLAADEVGENGAVIGVDMTPDMIHKARQNAAKRQTKNVQFRLGEIEHLPVADNTVDCVVSNCVINLSPDKPQVFREIHRILKVGGRIAVSDVIIRPEKVIPDRLKTAEALAC